MFAAKSPQPVSGKFRALANARTFSRIEPLESRIAPASVAVVAPVTEEIVTTLKDTTNATQTTGSLRDAILRADGAGEHVYILFETSVHGKEVPLKGVINIDAALGPLPAITGNVSIEGSGIVINGKGKVQGLSITSGATNVSINGLTIENGTSYSGGDLSIDGGTNISLTDVKLLNGKASDGAGLYINESGVNVTITGSLIRGNRATGYAGTTLYGGDGYGNIAYGGGI